MTLTVLRDSADLPSAFAWTGPVAPAVLDRWLARQPGLIVPDELLDLWRAVGGGVLFESESILEPFAPPSADDIDSANEHLRLQGLPPNLSVFHVGLCVSAVDQGSAEVVQLDYESFAERSRF